MQSLDFPVVLVGSDSRADVWDRAVSNGRVGEGKSGQRALGLVERGGGGGGGGVVGGR